MSTISSKQKKVSPPSHPLFNVVVLHWSKNQRDCIILVLPCTTLKEERGGGEGMVVHFARVSIFA